MYIYKSKEASMFSSFDGNDKEDFLDIPSSGLLNSTEEFLSGVGGAISTTRNIGMSALRTAGNAPFAAANAIGGAAKASADSVDWLSGKIYDGATGGASAMSSVFNGTKSLLEVGKTINEALKSNDAKDVLSKVTNMDFNEIKKALTTLGVVVTQLSSIIKTITHDIDKLNKLLKSVPNLHDPLMNLYSIGSVIKSLSDTRDVHKNVVETVKMLSPKKLDENIQRVSSVSFKVIESTNTIRDYEDDSELIFLD